MSERTTADPVEGARSIADTVLFEGYMLYPYRANDAKNRVRWQFGVLAPPVFAATDPSERDFLYTDCLLEGHDVTVSVHVRFLHVQRRTVQRATASGFADVESLDVGDATYLPWDEAVLHETVTTFALPGLGVAAERAELRAPAAAETELLGTEGRLVRERAALDATLTMEAAPMPGPYGVRRLRLRLENRTAWEPGSTPDRPEALRHALVAAHLLIEVSGGAFVSLIDPPEWARGYAAECSQIGAFPVLAGPPGDRRLMLASPIILYDHPQVAPESSSQFCDSTEMDEMLTLRTLTLTDDEKRQVRGSDPRGAALVDEIDALGPAVLERLHGAIRSMSSLARPAEPAPDEVAPWWDPNSERGVDPDTDFVLIDNVPVGRGAAVRLRPGSRRADAQDMFLDGRTATVEAVLLDVDGGSHLAVTLDELAEDGINPHGRFLYFAPDEVEPIVTPR
ncbi:MAG TPA: hypothetical protein VFE19_09530 [Jatrophihabitantaceae bacterium]|nr:hypothetical protein [Jatrophihabitantaceae bacterium]